MTDPKIIAAALRDHKPRMDLVGPTVDDDIRRAITRYGAEAVKDAVKRQTKPKRGRKPERDWPELRDVIQADAREWLEGGDPLATRSNYSIAKDFADKNPGQSHPATMKRIERKLVRQRAWMTLANAEILSRDGYPYTAHIRALEALSELDTHHVWAWLRDRAKSTVADYEAKHGAPPASAMSMKQVEDATRNALLTLGQLASPKSPGGLSGLFSSYAAPRDETD